MKTSRNLYSLVTACAAVACCLMIVTTANAQRSTRFTRERGSVERADQIAPTTRTTASRPTPDAQQTEATAAALKSYPRYRLIDLGTLGGDNAFIVGAAVTLNNRGENIAQASTGVPDPFPDAGFTPDGTIWHGILGTANGVVRDLGGLSGNQSVPTWIAEDGLIAGLGENGALDNLTAFPQFRALLWDKRRTLRDLGTLGGNDAAAVAINEDGDIAGFSATSTSIQDTTGLPTIHPFIWKNGRMRDLGSLGGTLATTGSFAFGPYGHILNEQGQVAGTSTLAGDETFHAFVWDKQRMIDLGTLGVRNSEAFFMSDNGQVLGRVEVSLVPYVRHGFLWEKGRITDLGTAAPCMRASPLSINSANQIVGDSGACTSDPNDPDYFSAFYQEKGKPPVDIHSLITPPSPIHLEDAVYINDRGEISAGGFDAEGRLHVVLLVPISRQECR